MTTFNGWLTSKILMYLNKHEGVDTLEVEYGADGIKTNVKDSFGFIYEITIKTVNRMTKYNASEGVNQKHLNKVQEALNQAKLIIRSRIDDLAMIADHIEPDDIEEMYQNDMKDIEKILKS